MKAPGAVKGLLEASGAVEGLLWTVFGELGEVQWLSLSRVVEGWLGDVHSLLGAVEGLLGAVEGFYRSSYGLAKTVLMLERVFALIQGLKVHSRRSVKDFIILIFLLLHLYLPCISLLLSPQFCEGLHCHALLLKPGSFD